MANGVISGFFRVIQANNSIGPLVVTQDGGAPATAAPAGTPATGGIVLPDGTVATPKFAKLNLAASATNTSVVALVAAKKIRVLAVVFVAGATATNLTFNTLTAGTAISALFANGANGGATLPFNPAGWFETTSGEGLGATTGAGSATGIQLTYIEV